MLVRLVHVATDCLFTLLSKEYEHPTMSVSILLLTVLSLGLLQIMLVVTFLHMCLDVHVP